MLLKWLMSKMMMGCEDSARHTSQDEGPQRWWSLKQHKLKDFQNLLILRSIITFAPTPLHLEAYLRLNCTWHCEGLFRDFSWLSSNEYAYLLRSPGATIYCRKLLNDLCDFVQDKRGETLEVAKAPLVPTKDPVLRINKDNLGLVADLELAKRRVLTKMKIK